MGKRGQLTLFIIVGFFMVGAMALGLFFAAKSSDTSSGEIVRRVTTGSLEENTFKSFMTSCLEEAGTKVLWDVGIQGGYLTTVAGENIQSVTGGPLTFYSAVPYGPGVPYLVPIYANMEANWFEYEVQPGQTERVSIATSGLPAPAPAENYLREAVDPPQGTRVTTMPQIGTREVWNGQALPSLEQIRFDWEKVTFELFDTCVQEGIGAFHVYADVQQPTDSEAYNRSRDRYLQTSRREDLPPEISRNGNFLFRDLDYTKKVLSVESSIEQEQLAMQVSYPLVVREGEKTLAIAGFRGTFQVGLQRLYNAANEFVQRIQRRSGTLPISSPTNPNNLYDLGAPGECATFRGTTAWGSTLLNGQTGIFPTRLLHLNEVMPTIDPTFLSRPELLGTALPLTNPFFAEYQIVQLVDFKPKEIKYNKPFIYQFALKNMNLLGRCAPSS